MTAATWNPSDKSASITLSGGNLIATCGASSDMAVRATKSHTTGKYYFEITLGSTYAGGDTGLGIATGAAALATVGSTVSGAALVYPSGATYVNGSLITNTTGALGTGLTVGVAVDLDNSKIWLRLGAGNWDSNAPDNPATNTGGLSISVLTGVPIFPCQTFNSSGSFVTANFGNTAFANAAPAGFAIWDSDPGLAPPPKIYGTAVMRAATF